MSEREKIKEALDFADAALTQTSARAAHGMVFINANGLDALRYAARKHLETLPKPVWRVTATLPPGDGRPAAPYETTDRDVALDFARGYLDQGMLWVSVKPVRL